MNCLICKNSFEKNQMVIRMIAAKFVSDWEHDGLSEYGDVHLNCLESKISGDFQIENEDNKKVVRTNILGFLE